MLKGKLPMEGKEKTVALVALGAFVLISALFYLVLRLATAVPEEEAQMMDEVKQSYAAQGVTIDDSELEVVTNSETGDKEIKVSNQSKRDAFVGKLNRSIVKEYEKKTGVNLDDIKKIAKKNKAKKNPDPDVITDVIADVETIVPEVNKELKAVKDYIDRSLSYNAENYTENYTQLLLDQRTSGSPSGSSPFVMSVREIDPTSYSEMQERLNGQCFWNVRYPNAFDTLEIYQQFNPYLWEWYSDDLFSNLITRGDYNKTLSVDDVISFRACDAKTYIMHADYETIDYEAVFEMKTSKGTVLLSFDNYKAAILDIV